MAVTTLIFSLIGLKTLMCAQSHLQLRSIKFYPSTSTINTKFLPKSKPKISTRLVSPASNRSLLFFGVILSSMTATLIKLTS